MSIGRANDPDHAASSHTASSQGLVWLSRLLKAEAALQITTELCKPGASIDARTSPTIEQSFRKRNASIFQKNSQVHLDNVRFVRLICFLHTSFYPAEADPLSFSVLTR